MKKVYQLDLDREELAALAAMLLIANGLISKNNEKISLGIMTISVVLEDYVAVCSRISELAGQESKNMSRIG